MKIQVLHNAVFALFIIHLISFVNLNAQEFSFEPPQVQKVRLKTVPRISSDEIDPSAIVGGSTPEDFINFMNSASPPDYSSDATYSIKLADIEAGGGLDYPLILTYNSNRVRSNMRPGIVGMGWDTNFWQGGFKSMFIQISLIGE